MIIGVLVVSRRDNFSDILEHWGDVCGVQVLLAVARKEDIESLPGETWEQGHRALLELTVVLYTKNYAQYQYLHRTQCSMNLI